MSKENLEQFMKQVADSEDLQAKIGEEVTGDALVALGAAHGREFSTENVQASAELSEAKMERVSGGAFTIITSPDGFKLLNRKHSPSFLPALPEPVRTLDAPSNNRKTAMQ